MLKNKFTWLACAALLVGVALTASAEDGKPDFDQLDFSVQEIVDQARDTAGSMEGSDLEAGTLETSWPIVTPNSVARRIVVFHKGTSKVRQLSLVRKAGALVTDNLWIINAVAIMAPQTRMQSFEASLLAAAEVKRIDEDFIQNWLVAEAPPAAAGPDILPQEEQGQTTPWGISRVNASQAWGVTRGAGVKVAVVDTGIDFEHPELNVTGGFNAIDPTVSFKDDNGHGSHVAGTIAAIDNDAGVVGIAPDVQLYGVKVLSASGSGTFADVIEGIQWCAANGMAVANFSLGASRGNQSLADAVKAAAEAGVAIIAAAGNSGRSVGFPAAYPEAIAIAASDSSDRVAYFSSRGPEVELIAPGVSVNSTWMGGGYRSISGTSMATPHVAGLAALAVAAQGAHGVEEIRAALTSAATKIPDVPDVQQGSGMIDALKLVSR
ncbi:MAG: S8 family peptidase [Elusimicrobiota bacterium]